MGFVSGLLLGIVIGGCAVIGAEALAMMANEKVKAKTKKAAKAEKADYDEIHKVHRVTMRNIDVDEPDYEIEDPDWQALL